MEDLHCLVCLEIPRRAVLCKLCKKPFCYKHSGLLEACPHCRSRPFGWDPLPLPQQERLDLLRKEEEDKFKESEEKTNCKHFKCVFKGTFDEIKAHAKQQHPRHSAQEMAFGSHNVEDPSRSEFVKAIYVTFGNNKVPPLGQVKKKGDYEFNMLMVRHCRDCEHEGCHAVWAGPWGPFVGGKMGRTHFDLTECSEGMEMNKLVGWKYQDYRH